MNRNAVVAIGAGRRGVGRDNRTRRHPQSREVAIHELLLEGS
jgi:hypothetical protein